jgi:hypothetical protein
LDLHGISNPEYIEEAFNHFRTLGWTISANEEDESTYTFSANLE